MRQIGHRPLHSFYLNCYLHLMGYSLFATPPEHIFKQRWFLVKINHEETVILNIQPETTGDYHIIFLARHPAD